MSLGIALSLIGVIISMEESGGGFLARWKWKWELLLWARKCIKNTSEVLYKKCVAEFVEEIVRNYKSRIFSEEEIEKICDVFLNNYPKAVLGKCELNKMLVDFNEKRLLFFSPAEKSIHDGMKEGLDNIKKEVASSKEEIMTAITNESKNDYWDAIVQRLNDPRCSPSDFGMFVVGKCNGFLERVVMLFPNIIPEKKEKYQKLFNQCCLETKVDSLYEIVVKVLITNFDGYIIKYYEGKPYYSSEFIKCLKNSSVVPEKITENDVLVSKIFEKLKSEFDNWDTENILSEYIEYLFDILTDEHVVKLAEPYIEIFIDNARQECSSYNSSVFKNKEIAKKIIDKCKNITNAKNSVVYPVLIKFFSSKKTSLIPLTEFKECMWRDFGRKLYELGVDKKDFLQIPI